MKKPQTSADISSYIFQIEVLVEGATNGEALEQLLRHLNNGGFPDYRIQSGVQLGQVLDERKAAAQTQQPVPIQLPRHEKPKSKPAPVEPVTTSAASVSVGNGFERIKQIIKKNSLIRLVVNKGLGITLNIPCRILNMNENENLITVYHVDEKQVYTFRLNEIEDYMEQA
ncbi:hypothetical protein [Paenibacillus harenae]|uniref:hypothetical protein n=1 Tax=Paenibacillus harenae TaxID=306543 RepID=UPI002792FF25|nr:hypothetical protein [Paenibacillus harenae]MDQ0058889.1 hypothetical protein [Paenibacillus harenae]